LDGPRLEDSGSYKTVEFLRRVLTNHFSYTVYSISHLLHTLLGGGGGVGL
jgi:hypothetical protein